MARILSGADFGVRFPGQGGVANNDFATNLSTQLLGQHFINQRQDELNERERVAGEQKAAQLQQVQGEKTRLTGIFTQLERIKGLTDPIQQRNELAKLGSKEVSEGRDGNLFIEALNADAPDQLNLNISRLSTHAGNLAGQVDEVLKANKVESGGKAGLPSAKTEIDELTGSTIQVIPTGPGTSEVIVTNPAGDRVEGQSRLDVLKNSRLAAEHKETTSTNLAVKKAREVAGAQARQSRISEVTKEYGDQRRLAQSSEIRLREASILAEKATQGLSGDLKIGFAKLFPSIDVSDEAALGAALKTLALDQLQKFKGPTTDFEFGVTEDISGKLGDPKTANIARIKSLQRNNWFVKRQAEQFRSHVKAGGDAESFDFNFGEPIKTKRGVVTLRDLQDTAVHNNISVDDVLKRLNQ